MLKPIPSAATIAAMFTTYNVKPTQECGYGRDYDTLQECGCALTVLAMESGFDFAPLRSAFARGCAGSERNAMYQHVYQVFGQEKCEGMMMGFDTSQEVGFNPPPSSPSFHAGYAIGVQVAELVRK